MRGQPTDEDMSSVPSQPCWYVAHYSALRQFKAVLDQPGYDVWWSVVPSAPYRLSSQILVTVSV